MTIYFPEAVKTQGTKKLAFVTTIASMAAPKIATEIKAASSVEGSNAIRSFTPTTNTNTGNSPARMGTTVQLPQEGNSQLQPIPVAFTHDPLSPDTDPDNKLRALLVEGATVYVVVRKGSVITTDWTVADRVDVWKCKVGHPDDDAVSGDDEFSEYEVHVNLIPLGPKVIGTLAA